MSEKPQPNREWLGRMADAEDAAGCISVGGLAADMGQPIPNPIWDAICCDKCSGFYLPSGRCDHCNQYRADTADKQGEQT